MVFKVPHEFREGELAYAKQVNANFSAVTEQLKELSNNKADVELSNINSSAINNIQKASLTRTIGEYVFSSLPVNNSSLHLLDGALLSGNGIYEKFVEYIAELYDNSSNYFTTEADWQTSVETYGVCAKFVYDSEENTVRLPKVTGIVEGTTDINALGDLVQAGLPPHTHTRGEMNITGTTFHSYRNNSGGVATGAYYETGQTISGGITSGAATGYEPYIVNFDASRSWTGSTSTGVYSPEIEQANTVQPQTVKAFVYIVVATSSKTDLEVNIDNIATDLNGKADVDGSNMNSSVKNFDGQWVRVAEQVSSASAVGSYTVDLSSYLPDDNYSYECIFDIQGYGNSGTSICTLQSSYFTIDGLWEMGIQYLVQNCILPIGSNRELTVNIAQVAFQVLRVYLVAYRRIGTNQ